MPVSKGPDCVGDEMKRFKSGQLHSGQSKKPVKSRKQALAIALSACGQSKYAETLRGLGYSEEASALVASFVESQKVAEAADEGPLSDVDSTLGKQKGTSGRRKQDPQSSVATFPTVPHAETRMAPQVAENAIKAIQDKPCEPKKPKDPAQPKQEVSTPTKPTTPTQPTQPNNPERQEIKDAAKKKAEQCAKNTGTQANQFTEAKQSLEEKKRKIKSLQREGHPASILIKQVRDHG